MLAIELGSTVRRAHLPNLLAEKIVLDRQLADLGVKLLNLARRRCFRVHADPRIERAPRVVQQLLLPRVDLVRMNLMALRQVGYRHLLPQRLQRDLRLQRRVNLPSRLRHLPLRPVSFGADFFQPSHWSQNPGPLQNIVHVEWQLKSGFQSLT